jgi:hypothetical protein
MKQSERDERNPRVDAAPFSKKTEFCGPISLAEIAKKGGGRHPE